MIDLHTYGVFIFACIGMGLIPGPNVALIVANSIAHGTRYGLTSVAGTCSAMVPQLTLTIFGTSLILSTTFLVIVAIVDSIWAITAGTAGTYLYKVSHIQNKISGGFFMVAAAGLALARKP